ncbi:MAG: hypothetical protein KGN78_01300 [Actinomycetales bacterium]|nr:hypothetical protein [Actinomycetales bacterium]
MGDLGPGGGTVFYDAGSRQSWGRYLEVAPRGWFGTTEDPLVPWCPKGNPGWNSTVGVTSERIGMGRTNTERILRKCGSSAAAGRAYIYQGGGKKDWFLPSAYELSALLDASFGLNAIKKGDLTDQKFDQSYSYWSSYEWNARQAEGHPAGGTSRLIEKNIPGRVRPIRAF